MLYEFRMYHTHEGRAEDAAERLTVMPPLFARAGLPVPSGQWIATQGDDLPTFCWMLEWPDSTTRAAAFAKLYSDPEWPVLREKTNKGREIMRHYNLVFLAECPAHAAALALHQDECPETTQRVHEVRLLSVMPGFGGGAVSRLINTDLPALKAEGARTLGVFDVMSGFHGPSMLHFLSWDSAEARADGVAAFNARADVQAARAQEIAASGNPFIRLSKQWLLNPVENAVAQAGLRSPRT